MVEKKNLNTGEGHRARLRDKFLELGLEGFTDAEVLELLLTFGTPRKDCKQPARDLLQKFGSFSAVLEAKTSRLLSVSGVGPKNCFSLTFIHAVAGRYLEQRIRGKRFLHSSKDVHDHLLHSLRGLKKEVLSVIYLDSSHAIIESEVVTEGTINYNTVYPREIVTKAIERHAAALIVAHNHPSGNIKPSAQDRRLTNNLYLTCKLMNINLLDHIIIGDSVYSMAENGEINCAKEFYSKVISDGFSGG